MSKDRRHPQKEIDRKNGGLFTFFIAYDRSVHEYFYYEKEKTFNELYQEIEELKNGEEVQDLINTFIDWINDFWSVSFKNQYHMGNVTAEQTYQDYLNLFQDIRSQIPMIKNYHLLLNIFGDISDTTYKLILKALASLEDNMKTAEKHIQTHFKNPNILVNHMDDPEQGMPLVDFLTEMNQCLTIRGYYVEEKQAYPNIPEVFFSKQFSEEFESDESRQQHIQDLLSKNAAKKFFPYK